MRDARRVWISLDEAAEAKGLGRKWRVFEGWGKRRAGRRRGLRVAMVGRG